MSFLTCYEQHPVLLMEGALGERLKREYHLTPDKNVALAGILYQPGGRQALLELWSQYIACARQYNLPFIATTPTRRANKTRTAQGGFDESIILGNTAFLKEIRDRSGIEMYVGGLMGCKGDAYKATEVLPPDEAFAFHSWQTDLFLQAGVDFLFAGIMPALPEAIGMAKAMEQTKLPYIISFMLRENGRLIDGTTIHDAVAAIDDSVTQKPVCYMANCVHPNILYKALRCDFNRTSLVRERFHGIQANTADLPPEALDNATELKTSDCIELAQSIHRLSELVNLKIIGGCCGTDDTHIRRIAQEFATISSQRG